MNRLEKYASEGGENLLLQSLLLSLHEPPLQRPTSLGTITASCQGYLLLDLGTWLLLLAPS